MAVAFSCVFHPTRSADNRRGEAAGDPFVRESGVLQAVQLQPRCSHGQHCVHSASGGTCSKTRKRFNKDQPGVCWICPKPCDVSNVCHVFCPSRLQLSFFSLIKVPLYHKKDLLRLPAGTQGRRPARDGWGFLGNGWGQTEKNTLVAFLDARSLSPTALSPSYCTKSDPPYPPVPKL